MRYLWGTLCYRCDAVEMVCCAVALRALDALLWMAR